MARSMAVRYLVASFVGRRARVAPVPDLITSRRARSAARPDSKWLVPEEVR